MLMYETGLSPSTKNLIRRSSCLYSFQIWNLNQCMAERPMSPWGPPYTHCKNRIWFFDIRRSKMGNLHNRLCPHWWHMKDRNHKQQLRNSPESFDDSLHSGIRHQTNLTNGMQAKTCLSLQSLEDINVNEERSVIADLIHVITPFEAGSNQIQSKYRHKSVLSF